MSTGEAGQYAPLIAAIRYGTGGFVVVAVVSIAVWSSVAGVAGLWGALIGSAVGGAFVLATVVTMYATRNVAPTTTGAILLGSWLLKVVLAIIVMVALRSMDFYDRPALVVTMLAALIVMLVAETVAIVRTRVPYVEVHGEPDSDVSGAEAEAPPRRHGGDGADGTKHA